MTEEIELSELDRKIVRLLQGEFPLVAEPYKALAAEIGITEEQLLARIAAMREEKKIRKMGAVLRHREVGFTANCLCVWNVPDERVDEVARRMAEHPRVSHCYDRNREADWKYNLYTMIHGYSREECENIAAELAAAVPNVRRVLDLGAGTGLMSAFVHTRCPQAEFTLADISVQMLAKAQERFCGLPNVYFIEQDLTRLVPDDRLPENGFDLIVSALIMNARLRGPGLRQLLGALADTARSELDMRQRVSASRAGTRRSAQIVVIFSIVVMLGLAVFNRSFVAPYSSVQGQLVLVVVVALFAVGMLWMRRLAGVRLPRRFLTVSAQAGGENA